MAKRGGSWPFRVDVTGCGNSPDRQVGVVTSRTVMSAGHNTNLQQFCLVGRRQTLADGSEIVPVPDQCRCLVGKALDTHISGTAAAWCSISRHGQTLSDVLQLFWFLVFFPEKASTETERKVKFL